MYKFMNTEKLLQERSGLKCELCSATDNLVVYQVPPDSKAKLDDSVLLCETCKQQINDAAMVDVNHWRCLNDSMWSQTPAVQVLAWRMLNRLSAEGWPQDLLEMLYLDEETLNWAKATVEGQSSKNDIKHLDSNGSKLEAGDSVTLIKDLNVKGANFTAKRGTMVRGISLVVDNPEHIEGKINGQRIVLLTRFVKKTT